MENKKNKTHSVIANEMKQSPKHYIKELDCFTTFAMTKCINKKHIVDTNNESETVAVSMLKTSVHACKSILAQYNHVPCMLRHPTLLKRDFEKVKYQKSSLENSGGLLSTIKYHIINYKNLTS